MEHLFNTFGEITPETFQQKEQEIKSKTFDPNTNSIDSLYKDIDDLVDLSGRTGVPTTPEQSVTISYVILWRCGVLKDYLKTWNAKLAAEKTWNNFKSHFRHGVKEYKNLRGPVMHDSQFGQHHQANLLQQLRDDVRTVISEEIAKHTANFASPFSSSEPPLPSPPFHEQSLPSPTFHDPYAPDSQMDHMANALSEYKQLVPQLINQVKELQQRLGLGLGLGP